MKDITSEFWKRFKQRVRSRWKGLQDEEIELYRDDMDRLCDRIHERFHEPRIRVQDFIDNLWFEIFVRSSKQGYRGRELSRDIDRVATGS